MDIGYLWDEDKYEKVLKKHNVCFHEVVSALEDPKGFEEAALAADDESRWMWTGKTFTGRVLIVIYSEEELPVHRLITAFDAEGSWLHEYQNRKRY